MLAKAFLSHHSADKEIVRPIANNLTRLQCYFDEQSFESGVEFDESIRICLEQAQIFVLILGRETLGREYVQKEIALAKELYENNRIENILTFIIADDVQLSDIPGWIKKIKYIISEDTEYITRTIQSKIDSINKTQGSMIIGRDIDLSEFEGMALDGTKKNNIYFVSGLDGIGRKTFSEHILKTKLSLHTALSIEVIGGDGPIEIAFNIRDRYYIESKEKEKILYNNSSKLTLENKIPFLIETLKHSHNINEAIIFYDKGGIFNIDGSIDEDIISMFEGISKEKNLPVFIVTRRSPSLELKFKSQHLRPLSASASTILLKQLTPSVSIPSEDLENIVNRVAGYPPSIQYAASLIERYGVSQGILEKIKNSFDICSSFLKDAQLCDEEKDILSLLSRYCPLSIAMIAAFIDYEESKVFSFISNLIDNSILEIVDGNFYEISKPLEYNISKLLTTKISDIDHKKMEKVLHDVLEKCGDDIKLRILFERLLTRAKLFSNTPYDNANMFSFASDILFMAQAAYNDMNYKKAIEYAKIAISELPKKSEGYEVLVKSFVREDEFENAKDYIRRYKKIGKPHSIHFLEGFLKRYDNDFNSAINSYKLALENGYRGASIHRELAQCYILASDNEKALLHAKKAYQINESNIFILDIYANTLSRNGKTKEARSIIDRMLSIQETDFTLLRASIFEFTQENYKKSYELVYKAINIAKKLTFELCFQAAICCIECEEIDSARTSYDYIQKTFKNKRKEMQNALLMRIYISEDNKDAAALIYNEIQCSKYPGVINIIKNLSARHLLP